MEFKNTWNSKIETSIQEHDKDPILGMQTWIKKIEIEKRCEYICDIW